MQSKAATVEAYLAELAPDRRAEIEVVRAVIRRNLDPAYEEGMQYGMIGYYVPHRLFPAGYHCDPSQPLLFAALAAQKNYLSVYLGCVYDGSPHAAWFAKAWAKSGKKLDRGKSCIRFRKAEDLALDVLGEAIGRMPVRDYIQYYEALRADQEAKKSRRKPRAPRARRKAPASVPARRRPTPKTAGRSRGAT